MFTKKTRFADMFSANNNLVLLMPRLGLGLGVGNRTVEEVCSLNNISADFVLLVCNMYTYCDYQPTMEDLEKTDLSMLVPYLRASHAYYIGERMPHLERHLSGVVHRSDSRYADAMMAFFEQYKREMSDHFAYEEQHVYPRLQEGKKVKGTASSSNTQAIKQSGTQALKRSSNLSSSHIGMVDKISDLLQILYKYMPSQADTEELNELIFGLLQLSSDFERHAAIEEHVLMPYLHHLERRNR